MSGGPQATFELLICLRIQPCSLRQHMPAGLGITHPVHPLPLLPALMAADMAHQTILDSGVRV